MNQVEKTWSLIKRRYTTAYESANKGGVLSLSQRVSEWRANGHVIADKWVTTGGGARVKAYRLQQERKAS